MTDTAATTVTRKAEPFSLVDPNVPASALLDSLFKPSKTSRAASEAPEPITPVESNPEPAFDALQENSVVNIVRQSVSPLPHATPSAETKVIYRQISSDDETGRQSYSGTSQSPESAGDSLLSNDLPCNDDVSIPQENIDADQKLHQHCLNSSRILIDSNETLLIKPESNQVSLIVGSSREDDTFGVSPTATAEQDDIIDDNSIDKEEEELQQMFSPSSDSFDWRDEASSIVQKSYKNKRRSSLFLAQRHRPSRLLKTPSPVKTSPEKSPTRLSSVQDDIYDEHARDVLNQLEESTESVKSHNRLSPGFQPTVSPACEDNNDHESIDGSVSELGREDSLKPIHEKTSENQSANITQDNEMEELQINNKRLELENSRLRESLQSRTRSYDFQIGPFRHAFETVSKQEVYIVKPPKLPI